MQAVVPGSSICTSTKLRPMAPLITNGRGGSTKGTQIDEMPRFVIVHRHDYKVGHSIPPREHLESVPDSETMMVSGQMAAISRAMASTL